MSDEQFGSGLHNYSLLGSAFVMLNGYIKVHFYQLKSFTYPYSPQEQPQESY